MNAPPRAVISGMSIAGLSTAFWLRHVGWDVTMIERAPAFRDGGQNVDVRGVAHQVLDRMGLTRAVAAQNTTETGTVFVDQAGTTIAELPSEGADGATAELEVLRGDFARTIVAALPDGVEVRYDTVIEHVDDGADGADGVTDTTSSTDTLTADLLVIAEGVRSTTRGLLFGDLVERRELGVTMVFGTIPRTPTDDGRWRWYNAVKGRQVHLRPDHHGTTRAILAYTAEDQVHEGLAVLDRDEALARVRERYRGVGWEAPRVLDAFDVSDDVYVDDLTQIRMPTWHRGRTCLVGDAAWSITPMGGGGASLALTGGYVLAALLSSTPPHDLERALAGYESWMRPVVDDAQKDIPYAVRHYAFPQTAVGLELRSAISKALASPLLTPLVAATIRRIANTDQSLPDIAGRTSAGCP